MRRTHENRIIRFSVKAVDRLGRLARDDAEAFMQRYPVLAMTPGEAWGHAMEVLRRRFPRFPIASKLALAFSLLITLGLVSLGVLFGINQSKLLEIQTTRLGSAIVNQAARTVKEPLLAGDRLGLETVAGHLVQEELVLGLGIYDDGLSPVVSMGRNRPVVDVEPSKIDQEDADSLFRQWLETVSMGGEEILDLTVPIRHADLTVGYVTVALDYSLLTTAKQATVNMVIATTVLMLLAGVATSIFLGKRLTRPINHLMEASRAISEGNYDYEFKGRRSDELGILMEAMNTMGKGLLQKEKVEQVFCRYVSPPVARQVLNDLENLESVQLGGRHVRASVLFADIVGFTSLSEEMDPQDVNSLLNHYFGHMAEAIHYCQGHIDKFMGDCAMVVFGVPEESEEHAFTGVACACMIQWLVKALNRRRQEAGLKTVEFRIGLNSGHMLAGNMGSVERMEFTVVGDTVNLAARLAHLARPGGVVITRQMYLSQHLQGRVTVEADGTMPIRGKKHPVELLRIVDIGDDFRKSIMAEIKRIIKSADPGQAA